MKRIGLISVRCIHLMLLTLALNGCQTHLYQQKQTITVKQFDEELSLTRDKKTNQLYFQSKNGDPKGCGKYWYSGTASFTKHDKQTITNLNGLIDINTLKIDTINQNEYALHDKNYQYFIVLTLCDNHVSYEKIRS